MSKKEKHFTESSCDSQHSQMYPVTFEQFQKFANLEEYVVKEMKLSGPEIYRINYKIRHKYYPTVYKQFYESESARTKLLRRGLTLKPIPKFLKEKILELPVQQEKDMCKTTECKQIRTTKKSLHSTVSPSQHKNISNPKKVTKSSKKKENKIAAEDSPRITSFFSSLKLVKKDSGENHYQAKQEGCKRKCENKLPYDELQIKRQRDEKQSTKVLKTNQISCEKLSDIEKINVYNEQSTDSNLYKAMKNYNKTTDHLKELKLKRCFKKLKTPNNQFKRAVENSFTEDVSDDSDIYQNSVEIVDLIESKSIERKNDSKKNLEENNQMTLKPPLPKRNRNEEFKKTITSSNYQRKSGSQKKYEPNERADSSSPDAEMPLLSLSGLGTAKVVTSAEDIHEWLDKGTNVTIADNNQKKLEFFPENFFAVDRLKAITYFPTQLKKYIKYLLKMEMLKNKPNFKPVDIQGTTRTMLTRALRTMTFEDYTNLISDGKWNANSLPEAEATSILTSIRNQYEQIVIKSKHWPTGVHVKLAALRRFLKSKGFQDTIQLKDIPPTILCFEEVLECTNLKQCTSLNRKKPPETFKCLLDLCQKDFLKCCKEGFWMKGIQFSRSINSANTYALQYSSDLCENVESKQQLAACNDTEMTGLLKNPTDKYVSTKEHSCDEIEKSLDAIFGDVQEFSFELSNDVAYSKNSDQSISNSVVSVDKNMLCTAQQTEKNKQITKDMETNSGKSSAVFSVMEHERLQDQIGINFSPNQHSEYTHPKTVFISCNQSENLNADQHNNFTGVLVEESRDDADPFAEESVHMEEIIKNENNDSTEPVKNSYIVTKQEPHSLTDAQGFSNDDSIQIIDQPPSEPIVIDDDETTPELLNTLLSASSQPKRSAKQIYFGTNKDDFSSYSNLEKLRQVQQLSPNLNCTQSQLSSTQFQQVIALPTDETIDITTYSPNNNASIKIEVNTCNRGEVSFSRGNGDSCMTVFKTEKQDRNLMSNVIAMNNLNNMTDISKENNRLLLIEPQQSLENPKDILETLRSDSSKPNLSNNVNSSSMEISLNETLSNNYISPQNIPSEIELTQNCSDKLSSQSTQTTELMSGGPSKSNTELVLAWISNTKEVTNTNQVKVPPEVNLPVMVSQSSEIDLNDISKNKEFIEETKCDDLGLNAKANSISKDEPNVPLEVPSSNIVPEIGPEIQGKPLKKDLRISFSQINSLKDKQTKVKEYNEKSVRKSQDRIDVAESELSTAGLLSECSKSPLIASNANYKIFQSNIAGELAKYLLNTNSNVSDKPSIDTEENEAKNMEPFSFESLDWTQNSVVSRSLNHTHNLQKGFENRTDLVREDHTYNKPQKGCRASLATKAQDITMTKEPLSPSQSIEPPISTASATFPFPIMSADDDREKLGEPQFTGNSVGELIEEHFISKPENHRDVTAPSLQNSEIVNEGIELLCNEDTAPAKLLNVNPASVQATTNEYEHQFQRVPTKNVTGDRELVTSTVKLLPQSINITTITSQRHQDMAEVSSNLECKPNKKKACIFPALFPLITTQNNKTEKIKKELDSEKEFIEVPLLLNRNLIESLPLLIVTPEEREKLTKDSVIYAINARLQFDFEEERDSNEMPGANHLPSNFEEQSNLIQQHHLKKSLEHPIVTERNLHLINNQQKPLEVNQLNSLKADQVFDHCYSGSNASISKKCSIQSQLNKIENKTNFAAKSLKKKYISKRSKQPSNDDYIPQKTHAFRSLPLAPNKKQPINSDIPNAEDEVSKKDYLAEDGPQFIASSTASQMLGTDCTYFENSILLQNLDCKNNRQLHPFTGKQRNNSPERKVNNLFFITMSEGVMARKIWQMSLKWKTIHKAEVDVKFSVGRKTMCAFDESCVFLFNFSPYFWLDIHTVLQEIVVFEYKNVHRESYKAKTPLHKALYGLLDSVPEFVIIRLISDSCSPYTRCEKAKHIYKKPYLCLSKALSLKVMIRLKNMKENLQSSIVKDLTEPAP